MPTYTPRRLRFILHLVSWSSSLNFQEMKVSALRAAALLSALAWAPPAHGLTSYSEDHYVVTDVRPVEAATRALALELCQRDIPGGLSAGVDWGTGPNGGVVHLCQVRAKVEDVKDSTKVLQRLGVFAGSSCPYDMKLVISPRAGVVVCGAYAASAKIAIQEGDFISDVTVTTTRNYNNEGPGWTTIPYSLHTQTTVPPSPYTGVFLSYRKPVRPIKSLEILNDVAATDVGKVCSTRLGAAWSVAGDFGFLDQGGSEKKAVICVDHGASSTSSGVLKEVVIVEADACDGEFQFKQKLGDKLYLWAKWANVSSTEPFIADLMLHRVINALDEASDPSVAELLPGGFEQVDTKNLNGGSTPVFLFQREWMPSISAATPGLTKKPLQAKTGSDATSLTFKILQLADLHYTGDPSYPCGQAPVGLTNCTEAVMTMWVNDLLDIEKPDFVAFTGDNVETLDSTRRLMAMDAVTSGVEARGIPYGMVFGNHDDENGFSREDIVKIAASKPHSYTQRGPIDVDGVGNYELGVQAPVDGPWGLKGSDVFRMYFLDSHAYADYKKYPQVSSYYDWVKPNQIAYYRKLSEAHSAAKNTVPAVMFFHIPLPEYSTNAASKTNGEQNEGVSSSNVNTNLFSTLVDRGEVKATFVGHDHANEFCYKRQDIKLCYGGGAGFGRAYGYAPFARRARAIEWSVDAQGKRTIRSWKRHYGDIANRKQEEVLYSETY